MITYFNGGSRNNKTLPAKTERWKQYAHGGKQEMSATANSEKFTTNMKIIRGSDDEVKSGNQVD